MITLKKMQNFADWSKEIMEGKTNICNNWEHLTEEESAKMREMFKKQIILRKMRVYLIVFLFASCLRVSEKTSINIFVIVTMILSAICVIEGVTYEIGRSKKRKNNVWEKCEGKLWMKETKYHLKYYVTKYIVIINSTGEEILFYKNLVYGKVQEGDEVVLVRPIGSKEINMCLKEDYDNYVEENA